MSGNKLDIICNEGLNLNVKKHFLICQSGISGIKFKC